MAAAVSGLTVQNQGKDYHCFLRHPQDNYALPEALKDDLCRQTAESVHIMIDNGQRDLRIRGAFTVFLRAVADLPQLKEVSITINHSRRMPASALSLLLKSAPHLKVLKLHDIDVEESPYVLAEVLRNHPSLHTLHLIRCHCRPVHVLVEALSTMQHLREVRLDGTLVGQQCDADATSALAALCQSPTLERLELVDTPEVGATRQLMSMMEALQHQPQQRHHQQRHGTTTSISNKASGLQELSIQVEPHESLPMGVIRAVARMLSRNETLTRLSVSWMGGGEKWLPIIEEGLAHNSTLKEFRLVPGSYYCRKNNMASFSTRFRQRTAAALRCNTCLTYLWFDSWEDMDTEIDLYLRANQLGRGYLLQQGANPKERPSYEAWMKALLASREHAHLTYYWLSHNPSLLQQN